MSGGLTGFGSFPRLVAVPADQKPGDQIVHTIESEPAGAWSVFVLDTGDVDTAQQVGDPLTPAEAVAFGDALRAAGGAS